MTSGLSLDFGSRRETTHFPTLVAVLSVVVYPGRGDPDGEPGDGVQALQGDSEHSRHCSKNRLNIGRERDRETEIRFWRFLLA